MKTTTFLALVAAATLGYATPVPEQQAEAGKAEKATYPPSGMPPNWPGYPPAPQAYDPSPPPPSYPPPHPYSAGPPPPDPYGSGPSYPNYPPLPQPGCGDGPCSGGPPSGGFFGGGAGGGWSVGGDVSGGGGFAFGGGASDGLPSCNEPWCAALPPPPHGMAAWPINGFPDGSLLNNGGLQQFAGDCSAQQQALSCCHSEDSSSDASGILPTGSCGTNLFSPHCGQKVACCDTTGGGLITIGGLCQALSL